MKVGFTVVIGFGDAVGRSDTRGVPVYFQKFSRYGVLCGFCVCADVGTGVAVGGTGIVGVAVTAGADVIVAPGRDDSFNADADITFPDI